ncbi:PREDICTED: uncharacterized protein LOC101290820 [Fragaria vesca subsp. vesca]
MVRRRSVKKKSATINSMLDEHVLGLILEKIKDKEDRDSFSEVCKSWLRVERVTRRSLRVRQPIPLKAMTAFPYLVHFKSGELTTRRKKRNKRVWEYPQTDTHLEVIANRCHELETFKVSCRNYDHDHAHLGPKGLHALAFGCPKLSTLGFCGSKVVGNPGVDAFFHSVQNLKNLYLIGNVLISDRALRAIGSSSISTLELVYCDNITDEGLGFLANGSTSKTLKKLVLKDCPKITDKGAELLRNMCRLEHLALCCKVRSRFTDTGGVAISAFQTLKELRLSHVDVSDRTMVALAENCSKLETLDVESYWVTGAGIRAFSGHKCLKHLSVMYGSSAKFDKSDVERLALGCPSLKSVIFDKSLEGSFEPMLENTRRIIKFKNFYTLPPFMTTDW